MNTVLIIFLLNLANPNEHKMIHKSFPTTEACTTAFVNMVNEVPKVPGIVSQYYCVPAESLVNDD